VEVHNGGKFDGGGTAYVDGGVEGDEEIEVSGESDGTLGSYDSIQLGKQS